MTDKDFNEMLAQDAADVEASADTTALQFLGEMAWQLDADITAAEAALKAKKKALVDLLERKIPEAMTAAGLPEFSIDTPEGGVARISNGTKVMGSLRYAADQDAAVAYLEASGFGGGVKTVVSIDFTEEEREDAQQLVESVEHLSGRDAHVAREISPQTLMAFGRSMIKDDPTWDYERVGLKAYPAAKFTKRK